MANWFIGLPIPSDPWFQTLPEPPANVRPFAAEDLHVSVAFLGRVEAEQASAAFELAQNWPTGPIPATLEDVRPMGDPRPRLRTIDRPWLTSPWRALTAGHRSGNARMRSAGRKGWTSDARR